MTDTSILDDPQHWRDRAEEIRRLAEDMREPETRRMMLSIAEGYDKLVERAEERAKGRESHLSKWPRMLKKS